MANPDLNKLRSCFGELIHKEARPLGIDFHLFLIDGDGEVSIASDIDKVQLLRLMRTYLKRLEGQVGN